MVAAVSTTAGCREDTEVPPQFNYNLSAAGRGLPPIEVPEHRKDKEIIGSAASAEEVGSIQEVTAAAGPQIPIQDSTAREIVASYIKIREAGAFAQMPQVLIERQREPMQQMVEALLPVQASLQELLDVLQQSFPDAMEELPTLQLTAQLMAPVGEGQIEIEGFDELSETEAEARLVENVPVRGEQPVLLYVLKTDPGWRIELADFQAPESPQAMDEFTARMGQAGAAFEQLIAEIEAGEINSTSQLVARYQELMNANPSANEPVAASEAEEATDGEDSPAPARPANQPNQPRNRNQGGGTDPMDTVPGPGFLNRG
jgi:hypothetical protein